MKRNPNLEFKLFLRSLVRRKVQVCAGGEVLYGYARQAIEDIYRLLGLESGDTVLYPDYICDVALAPCRKLGLGVEYYPLNDDLQPEWEVVEEMLAYGKAKVVLSVNYFGFPQAIDTWRLMADKYNAVWIEDNAHGYGSRYQGRELGSFGDVGVSGLRKVLPLLNGASLRVNRPERIEVPPSRSLPLTRLRRLPGDEEMRVFAKWILEWLRIPINRSSGGKVSSLMESEGEDDHRPLAIDFLSWNIFALVQGMIGEYMENRRAVYNSWEGFCPGHGLQPVFSQLSPEVSPMVYACYAKDPGEQQEWLDWGDGNGIDVYPWPCLPHAVRDPGRRCIHRYERLLCFPIHHGIAPETVRTLKR